MDVQVIPFWSTDGGCECAREEKDFHQWLMCIGASERPEFWAWWRTICSEFVRRLLVFFVRCPSHCPNEPPAVLRGGKKKGERRENEGKEEKKR